jgi:tRNA threonylcarbamoyladenosine biosynthesis protein TsaE
MGRDRIELILEGPDATREFAARLGPTLSPNTVLALYGNLGVGKTTFLQGLVRGLGGDESMVHSPTYVYLHHYPTSPPLFHFDLYRLSNEKDFLALGFEEYLEHGGISAIEWPERIASLLPPDCIHLRLSTESPTMRRMVIE